MLIKKLCPTLCLLLFLFPRSVTGGPDNGARLNLPIPASAQQMVKEGIALRERDQFEPAANLFKKALATAPNYVQAHVEYVRTRAFFQHRYDAVRAEYDAFVNQNPTNPVYVLVRAMVLFQMPGKATQDAYARVVELAPEWAWGHFARASLSSVNAETAIAELQKCIVQDDTGLQPYYSLIFFQKKLGKIDDAIETATKLAAKHGMFSDLWTLRLTKAKASDETKAALKTELLNLGRTSSNVKLIGQAYLWLSDTLKDAESAKEIEKRIHSLDHDWYPERGQLIFTYITNESSVPRTLEFTNRQYAIFAKLGDIDDTLDEKTQIARIEPLLTLNPEKNLRELIYQHLFHVAEKANDHLRMVRYGRTLYGMDPGDVALLAKISIALAYNKLTRAQALAYARKAEQSSARFELVVRPPDVSPEWFNRYFPGQEQQMKSYNHRRALALEALGWALAQAGRINDGVEKLRLSVQLKKTESSLSHLSQLLRRQGRTEEAEALVAEAGEVWINSVKATFTNEPAKDFELRTIDNRRVKLSELKGKLVMLNFWATWCGPCLAEAPYLVKAYDKYKERGFEILAISVDNEFEQYKVPQFAKQYGMNFTVLYDEGVDRLYGVKSYPTNIFIDREGNVRYQQQTFSDPHHLEAIVQELLK
jgi:peroxiredoxin